MAPDRTAAVQRLREISRQARYVVPISLNGGDLGSLRSEAAALVASFLGADHYLVTKLDQWVPFTARGHFGSPSPGDEFCGLVDAAASIIGRSDVSPVGVPAVDAELWSHVSGLVEGALWDKVPAAVVTFTEDWFRRLAGNPPNSQGGKLYGRGLFATVLRPGGALALGSDPSEQEGWRELGQGLAKAIGNGHRHSLQDRADAERVAWGVIGLGSLLIGEARRTYGDPLAPESKSL